MSDKKKLMNPKRRAFLGGTGLTLAGGAVGLGFAPTAMAGTNKVLIYLFLRGGCDGLNLIVPRTGANYTDYVSARPNIHVNTSNSLTLSNFNNTNPGSAFGIHPAAAGLRTIFNQGDMAIIQACGHKDPTDRTRSHFDAQEQIELGTPGSQASQSGWLARYLQTTSGAPGDIFSALASSSNPPNSLRAWPDVATISTTGSFHPDDFDRRYQDTHIEALRSMYAPSGGSLEVAGSAALDAIDLIAQVEDNIDNYVPQGGAQYPNTGLGRNMLLIAQLINEGLGIRVATADIGGWDTHNNQGAATGNFANRVTQLSEAVTAFFVDMRARGYGSDIGLVIQSEFGRQINQNGNVGTDHGHGNPMLVLSQALNGGIYGDFLGVSNSVDNSIIPTTDFRTVLAGVTEGVLGNTNTATIFNSEGDGFDYTTERPNLWFV